MRIKTPWDVERLALDWDYFLTAFWEEMRLSQRALTEYERMCFRFGACGDPLVPQSTRRRVVLAFRGAGKTTGITAPVPCWRWYRESLVGPVRREIIISSKNDREVIKLAAFIRQALGTCTFLKHLAPSRTDVDNRTCFNIAGRAPGKQHSLTVGSIAAALEGGRAHTIIADDIETKKNAATAEGREELQRQASEFTNIIYPDAPVDDPECSLDPHEVIIIQTPKHDDSICVKFHRKGFVVRSFPLILPRANEPEPYFMDKGVLEFAAKHRIHEGSSLAAKRFPDGCKEIVERRGEGPVDFYRENQCAVDLKDKMGFPLKLADLIVTDLPPPPAKLPASMSWGTSNHNGSTRANVECIGHGGDSLYGPAIIDDKAITPTNVQAAIDPSGVGSDKLGLAIGAAVGGYIYVYGVHGLPGGFDEDNCERLALILKEHRVTSVTVETNMDGAGVFRQNLRKMIARHTVAKGDTMFPDGWTCGVAEVHNVKQKEHRIIDVLSGVMSSHRLVMDRRCLMPNMGQDDDKFNLKNELQHQIANITRDKHSLREDGKIDALAMLVQAFQSTQRMESAVARERDIERERQRELQRAEAQTRRMLGIKDTPPRHTTWRA